jgi:SAM-dependent methyltransferase
MAVATEVAYDALARFYDSFTAESDYDVWTRNVLEVVEGLGLGGNGLLDLACGTGNSFIPFLAHGFDVTACDLSRAMLDEAARKAPDATLVHADVRDLGTVGRFDLVTCFDDALNYLLEEGDLLRGFETVAANLAPAGIGLFDLNTLRSYRSTFARDRISERDGALFAWRGDAAEDAGPGCLAAATIEVFAANDDGLYERTPSRHVQRHHPRERVLALLAGADLDCVGVYGVDARGGLDPELDEVRHVKALYAVRHVKGGDAQ